MLSALSAYGAPKEQDRAILEGNDRNILSNPGFEGRKSNWTNTGSSTFTLETAAPAAGLVTAKWDPSASGEFFRSEVITVPEGLKNRPCSLVFDYKWAGVSAEIKANVDDGSGDIATVNLDPSATDYRQSPPLMFTCPGSGTIQVELESTADAAEISLDAFEFGKLKTIDVSQTELIAKAYYPVTASCIWSHTGGTVLQAFPAAAACVSIVKTHGTGNIDTADNDLPDIVILDAKPGLYVATVNIPQRYGVTVAHTKEWQIFNNIAAEQTSCKYHYVTSTNSASTRSIICSGSVEVLTTQDLTFSVYGAEDSSGDIQMQNALAPLQFEVVKYPINSAQATTFETSGFLVNAKIVDAGGFTALSATDTGAFVVIEDSTLTLTNLSGGTVDAKIACEDGIAPIGDTCGGDAEQYGINFNVPSAGNHEVCFRLNHILNGTGGSENLFVAFNLVKTTASDETIVETYPGAVVTNSGTLSTIHGNSHALCTTQPLSVGDNTIRMRAYTSITSGLIGANQVTSKAIFNGGVFVTVRNLDQQMPAPVFTELTNSLLKKLNIDDLDDINMSKGRIETFGASGTLLEEFGSFVSSVTRNGAGDYHLTFDASFYNGTDDIVCQCLPVENASTTCVHANFGIVETTQARFRIFDSVPALIDGAASEEGFTFSCAARK